MPIFEPLCARPLSGAGGEPHFLRFSSRAAVTGTAAALKPAMQASAAPSRASEELPRHWRSRRLPEGSETSTPHTGAAVTWEGRAGEVRRVMPLTKKSSECITN